jgi:hypothetical protein
MFNARTIADIIQGHHPVTMLFVALFAPVLLALYLAIGYLAS